MEEQSVSEEAAMKKYIAFIEEGQPIICDEMK